MHESTEELEIWPNLTTDCRVSCPCPSTYNGKNGVATFSQLFLIKSFSYLQVMIRDGVIKKVIVINCNLITFSKIIECNCN